MHRSFFVVYTNPLQVNNLPHNGSVGLAEGEDALVAFVDGVEGLLGLLFGVIRRSSDLVCQKNRGARFSVPERASARGGPE